MRLPAIRDRRAVIRNLGFVLLCVLVPCLGCSGPEDPVVQSDPPPEDEATRDPVAEEPPAEDPPAEPGDDESPPCAADSDCAMQAACCGCPRVATAMHRTEAERIQHMCARVRCMGCPETAPPGPPQVARCVDSVCVARRADDAPAAAPACTRDDQCAIHTPCCACPGFPQAMHVDAIQQDNARCAVRSCVACDEAFDGPVPSGARCADGTCVPVP